MRYGVRWEHICLADLEAIYGDLRTADAATRATELQLSRDPFRFTWELSPKSLIRLAAVKPYLTFPAVYVSFCVMDDRSGRYCLALRARRANVPGSS